MFGNDYRKKWNDPHTTRDNETVGDYVEDARHNVREGLANTVGRFLYNNRKGIGVTLLALTLAAGYRGSKYWNFDDSAIPPVRDAVNVATYNDRVAAMQYNFLGNVVAGATVDVQENWKWYLLLLAAGPALQAAGRKIANIRVK
jgi:hypothetical protein